MQQHCIVVRVPFKVKFAESGRESTLSFPAQTDAGRGWKDPASARPPPAGRGTRG